MYVHSRRGQPPRLTVTTSIPPLHLPTPPNPGTKCDDYNADTTNDVCVAGTCTGTNLCDGVKCPAAKACNNDNYCFRGKCLAGSPVKEGADCDFIYEDETEVVGKCNAFGACLPPAPQVKSVDPEVIKIPGGGSVTIKGSNFRMGSLVEFNGVSMPTAWRGTNTLVATHPPTADTSGGLVHDLGIISPGEGKTVFKEAYTIKEALAPWNKDPWGNGKDGAMNCNNMEEAYHDASWAWKVKNTIKFDGKHLILGAAPGSRLAKGDKLLFHVAQDVIDTTDNDKRLAGLHEFLIVQKVDGTSVFVTSSKADGVTLFDPEKGHDGVAWGKLAAYVQRVPQYTKVELTNCVLHPKSAANFQVENGRVWTGIIAFQSKTTVKITKDARIDASNSGHRGGKMPDRNRGEGGQQIRTPGHFAADALNRLIPIKDSEFARFNGKSNQWGGDGGGGCEIEGLKIGKGGKGGCHHDVGCGTSTGGKGVHGGGGGGRDHGYQGGSGGAGSLCPGQYYKFLQSKRVDSDGVVDLNSFSRIVHGGGASSGGGGGRGLSGGGGGKAVGNGCYRSKKTHGGGDGGAGGPGGGIVYILAKDGVSGGGLINAIGGKGGGGGGGELGGHKTSGGGGGAGGNGGAGGTIVIVTSPDARAASQTDIKYSVVGGPGGGGGGGGGVPNQHNPTASGAGGGGAKALAGALGGGGGGGSPSARGPYNGGNGGFWNGDFGKSGGYSAGADGAGSGGRGRYPGGGGGCSKPGGSGGAPWKGGKGAASSSCNGDNYGKDGSVNEGGAGGKGDQACGRDSNSGAGGGGGGPGSTGFPGQVFFAVSLK